MHTVMQFAKLGNIFYNSNNCNKLKNHLQQFQKAILVKFPGPEEARPQ